jgi:hypothetical protein
MGRCIIEVGVKLALRKTKKLNHQCPHGKQQDTRKKPHAIVVALEQSIRRNYWFIM